MGDFPLVDSEVIEILSWCIGGLITILSRDLIVGIFFGVMSHMLMGYFI